MPEFVELSGIIVQPEALKLPRAIAVVEFLTAQDWPYMRPVEYRVSTEGGYKETIVFDAGIELPQDLAADIRSTERIAAVFTESDDTYPGVLALRSNFPEILHLFQEREEFPRSICLYERSWQDLKLSWTALSFVERIREWLSKTAHGELHQDDQPLEPIILGSVNHIILPPEVFDSKGIVPDKLNVHLDDTTKPHVYDARKPDSPGETANRKPIIAHVVRCEPVVQQVLSRTPQNLEDLSDLLKKAGFDLLNYLRKMVNDWIDSGEDLNSHLILIIHFPKKRTVDDPVEQIEVRGFFLESSLDEIGEGIGIRGQTPDSGRGRLLKVDESLVGSNLPVFILNPLCAFDGKQAAIHNDLPEPYNGKIAAIGAGALGSQVIMNLARAGYGNWFIVDKDVLLPHNLARHQLLGDTVGWNKAQAVAATIHTLFQDPKTADWSESSIFDDGENGERINKELEEADLILDMAASISVSRYLAHHPSDKRRISLFMNPTGRDLVLIVEDQDRSIKLDSLEMQYYRGLLEDDRLAHHYMDSAGRVRYGQSCRDLSSRIPQDLVAMQAAMASKAVKLVNSSPGSMIRVWTTDPDMGSVSSVDIPVNNVTVDEKEKGWSLVFDGTVLEKTFLQRAGKLPNETGGVLIGTHDMERKKVYIVDVLLSPVDSQEWPTHYIRGCQDLVKQVEAVSKRSGYHLDYVGEWHSHPDGCGVDLGTDDRSALSTLTTYMSQEGKPAVMLIVGDERSYQFYMSTLG